MKTSRSRQFWVEIWVENGAKLQGVRNLRNFIINLTLVYRVFLGPVGYQDRRELRETRGSPLHSRPLRLGSLLLNWSM